MVGCLTGMWDAQNSSVNLPALVNTPELRDCVPCVTSKEYDGPLSESNIRARAAKVSFAEHECLFDTGTSVE